MAKIASIFVMLVSLATDSALAVTYTNHVGLFRMSFTGDPLLPECKVTEWRTRSTYKLGVLSFTASTLWFLAQFDGQNASARSSGGELADVTFTSQGPTPHSLTVWRDGILYFGNFQAEENKPPEIVIETLKGTVRFPLKGPIVKYSPDFLEGDVVIEGWIRDDGRAIEVAKLKRENKNGSETVLVTGMLNSAIPRVGRKKEYYIEGPNHQRTWIKKRLNAATNALIGTQVFAYGHYTASGQLDPSFLNEELSEDDLDCAGRLMNEIFATQKDFQSNWKKQK